MRTSILTAPLRYGTLVIHPVVKSSHGGADTTRLPQAKLLEAVELVRAIDLEVVATEIVMISRIRPATYIGLGTTASLEKRIVDRQIGLVIFNCSLSPIQQRYLELAWKTKVIDRTALILEIFGARACTREGILQVELAHLSYQRSRLVRSWTHLERQRGGFGFLGGPGEAQIEVDRRLIGNRIAHLQREIEAVKRTRALHRQARRRMNYPVVTLVGYTNAGKSTLFNRLTQANTIVANRLFATLDPTMRALRLPSGRTIILSDTVGFISNLPHELIASFRATLEEVALADIVVHVRDVAHPDCEEQLIDVETVLRTLRFSQTVDNDLVQVCNKIDLLEPEAREELANTAARNSFLQLLSAETGEGIKSLLIALDSRLARGLLTKDIAIPLTDGATLSWLYRHGEVLERYEDSNYIHMQVRLSVANFGRLQTWIETIERQD